MKKDLSIENYECLIFYLRGKKVMVDSDLAKLYNVPTKALKQQVRRNSARFPSDFMFELTIDETKELVTNCDRLNFLKHSSVNPMVFTEQGVAMLSTVLRSEKAIMVNIEIMRAFVRYRGILRETEELRKTISVLEKQVDQAFKFLMEKMDELHQNKNIPRKPIGYIIGGREDVEQK